MYGDRLQRLQQELAGRQVDALALIPGADMRYMAAYARILDRNKKSITLMDCAKFLFDDNTYFEVKDTDASEIVDLPIDRLASHFRGYLVKDEEYVNKLFSKRT